MNQMNATEAGKDGRQRVDVQRVVGAHGCVRCGQMVPLDEWDMCDECADEIDDHPADDHEDWCSCRQCVVDERDLPF